MVKYLSERTLLSMQARAIRGGAIRHSLMTVEWDISGSCENPTTRELVSVNDATFSKKNHNWSRTNGQRRMILHARCRQCSKCLYLRSHQWSLRILSEVRDAPRTWFTTFTLTSREQWRIRTLAYQRLRSRGWTDNDVDVKTEWIEVCRQFGKLLTDFFKRVRKNTGRTFRYVLVSERHKSGDPHFHALIHDVSGKLTYRELTGEWPYGFMHCKLVEDTPERVPYYVTKYVAKYALSRIRCSLRYGSRALRIASVADRREACAPPAARSVY